jgi:RNA polymerase sigma factor (sigma-70 family)
MMNDDMELVRECAARQSEQAFDTLVSRNVSLVHSAALRQLRDPHLTEEITQTVFIILARKAGSLNPKTILPGWLYRTTRYVSAAALKIQRRRERREQEAHMQAVIQEAQTDPAWEQFSPLLDEAMADLRDRDRDAIVLRYFQNRSLRDVGAALGVDEYAAQKRVARALEKLRVFFVKRGVASTAETIAGMISANSVQAAPVVLAKAVAAVAMANGATASLSTSTLIQGALKIMAWTKAKTAVVAGACVLLAAGTTTITIYNVGKPMRTIQSDWSAISGDNGQWVFADGQIEAHTTTGDSILASSEKHGDVTFSALASTDNREASLAFRMQDAANGYILNFVPVGSPGEPNGFVRLRKRIGNDETTLATYQGQRLVATGKSAKIKVVAKGSSIQVFLNEANVLRVHDTTFTNGYIGFRIYGWQDFPCDATFSDVAFH